MKKLFAAACFCFIAAWCAHLALGTAALRGFFGDGSLVFLLALSKSYMMGGQGHLAYLYDAGAAVPRNAQFLLNNLGLQAALALDIHDAAAFKYIFNFWQFASPGFLYLGLLAALARAGRLAWGIFPLLSWAVLSVPVDWNAVNSSRWAVPIFWMHIMLVLLAGRRVRLWPSAAAGVIGIAMLGGLYETVVLQACLAMAAGAIIGRREGNRVPLLYACAAVPGAGRAAWAYFIGGGDALPNGAPHLVLPQNFDRPYFLFVAIALAAAAFVLASPSRKIFWPAFAVMAAGAAYALTSDLPDIWPQIESRYDYVLFSFGLMTWAAVWRIAGWKMDKNKALPAATLALFAGSVLWLVQAEGTDAWSACRAGYDAAKADTPLVTARGFMSLFKPRPGLGIMPAESFGQCLWDWAEPWTDLLLAPGGPIEQWPQFTFWQQFAFVTHDGAAWLRSNNWTLVSPSVKVTSVDLPLTTRLYDMTPLYRRIGDGEFFPRAACLDPLRAGPYWRDYLTKLDDAGRQAMFVCPRAEAQP